MVERFAVAFHPCRIGEDKPVHVGERPERVGNHRHGTKFLRQGPAAARHRNEPEPRQRQNQNHMKNLVFQQDSDDLAALQAERQYRAGQIVEHLLELRIGEEIELSTRRADRRLVGAHSTLKQDRIDDVHGASTVRPEMTSIFSCVR